MHTPEEARDLWCPMVRIARRESTDTGGAHFQHMPTELVGGVNHDALSGDNRRISLDHKPLASCRCIAQKCAMWRWGVFEPRDVRVEQDNDSFPGGKEVVIVKSRFPVRGYCGIAGRPEVA